MRNEMARRKFLGLLAATSAAAASLMPLFADVSVAPPGKGGRSPSGFRDPSVSVPFSLKAGESCVFDFGPEGVGGYPTVTFGGTEGTARVRLAYATHPDGLGPKGDFWHETRATYMGPDLWLPILPASTDRFDVFERTGAGTWRAPLAQGLVRYAKLTVESGAATVNGVTFANDGIHSEEPVVGSFSCSDEKVNGVWRASVRTCQLAAIPARTKPLAVRGAHTNAVLGTAYAYLSDGAKRDRLVWSGDLWFAQGNMYAAFAHDSPYMPGSIRMLAENRTPDGYVQACPFPESHGPLKAGDYGPFASDEFAAWFIPVLCDHVLHTGDLDLAREMRPVVRELVAYLVRYTAKDGIFEQRLETCKHSCGLAVGGTSLHHRSYMNVLCCLAYRDAARLADWLGDAADAAAWTALADRTARAVRAEFWNAQKGHFVLSREEVGMGFEANALALAARFATPEEAARILPQLKYNWHGKFQLLAIRGAFAYGQGVKAMELVAAHNWYRYLAPEWKGLRTVQECCNLTTKGWGDEAHPDACLAGVFTEGILGVRPLEPGYRTFAVTPHPSASVTSARGSVPTPYGPIEVSWRLGAKGVELTVRNPPGTRRVADDSGRGRAAILLPDPAIVAVGPRYYLTGTESAPPGDPVLKPSDRAVFPLFVSDDLRIWHLAETANGAGRCLDTANAFGRRHFWAPQLFVRDGRWYLAYTCDFRWGIAVGDRPEGPFEPWMSFAGRKGQAIDPFVFQDEDGSAYVYFSSADLGGMAGARLSSDLRSVVGEPVKCITNDQPWERKPLEPRYEELNRKFGYGEWDRFRCGVGTTEGPTVVRRHGKYVLFYSANDFRSPDYCVGVAVADRPLGPWRKLQTAAVLSREQTGLNGTGHGDAFVGPDGALWYVFHAHHSDIRVSPRRTGVIRLVETVGADGYPRYAADPQTMRLLNADARKSGKGE